jgi:hypothetical protein
VTRCPQCEAGELHRVLSVVTKFLAAIEPSLTLTPTRPTPGSRQGRVRALVCRKGLSGVALARMTCFRVEATAQRRSLFQPLK